jgi:hypothetical protein
VANGGTITFDVFVDDIPEAEDFAGFDYYVTWAPQNPTGPPTFNITSQTYTTAAVNLIAQGGGPFSIGTGVPNQTSPHHAVVGDLGAAETSPPYTQGVLGRYTAQVGPGMTPGVYDLDFSFGPAFVSNSSAVSLCDLYTCTLQDGDTGFAQIAVDTACGGAVQEADVAIP